MNQPNYPASTSAHDVERYFAGTSEVDEFDGTSEVDEMLHPTCTECGKEVMSAGIMCPPCLEGVPDMTARSAR